MTKRDFLKYELLKKLDEQLIKHGFKLNKKVAEFNRKTKRGWHKLQIIFILKSDGWGVEPAIFIRVNQIEEIFHRTSGFEPKYQKGTPTIGLSLNAYAGELGKYSYLLTEESDIDKIASIYLKAVDEYALPFFDQYDNLEVMERAVNADPYDAKFTGPIFKGSEGLILAKMTKKDNYNELVKRYTHYYEQLADGFYLPSFKALVEDLEKS
jgi:hypothetical protein